jgi:hypothetical protein
MNLENLPYEVIEVIAYQMAKRPVGLETYNKIKETIDKYPQYFPWEHLYNSIPSEVHARYNAEELSLYYSFYPPSGGGMKQGEGIVAYASRLNEENKNKPTQSLEECIKDMFQASVKRKKQYEKEKKKLWDKHYKKYNLKLR